MIYAPPRVGLFEVFFWVFGGFLLLWYGLLNVIPDMAPRWGVSEGSGPLMFLLVLQLRWSWHGPEPRWLPPKAGEGAVCLMAAVAQMMALASAFKHSGSLPQALLSGIVMGPLLLFTLCLTACALRLGRGPGGWLVRFLDPALREPGRHALLSVTITFALDSVLREVWGTNPFLARLFGLAGGLLFLLALAPFGLAWMRCRWASAGPQSQ